VPNSQQLRVISWSFDAILGCPRFRISVAGRKMGFGIVLDTMDKEPAVACGA
jgi:hypothetical protein